MDSVLRKLKHNFNALHVVCVLRRLKSATNDVMGGEGRHKATECGFMDVRRGVLRDKVKKCMDCGLMCGAVVWAGSKLSPNKDLGDERCGAEYSRFRSWS